MDEKKLAKALGGVKSRGELKKIAAQSKGKGEEPSALDMALDDLMEALKKDDGSFKDVMRSVLKISKDSE